MLWAREKGRNIYSTWTLTNYKRKQLAIHYEKIENYCKPKSNKIHFRYIFMRREQGTDKPFVQFVTDLKKLHKKCGYDYTMEDEMIRDHIVFGIKIHQSTVSHFSYAPLFQGPHFLTKMLEPNILYDNLFIDILSV